MYYGSKLSVRELEDVKNEIDALSVYVKSGMRIAGTPEIVYEIAGQWDRKGVFLQDGDALVYPFPKLVQALEHLNQRLPFVQRIATYAQTGYRLYRVREWR
jgi:hypothetical protein